VAREQRKLAAIRAADVVGYIAGMRWSTKRYLNMELLKQRNALIA
jgi:hypothetical protein